MKSDVVDYQAFALNLIEADSYEEVPTPEGNAYYRVELPNNPNNITEMSKKGYVFADRTLGVTINLKKSDMDYQKLIRFDIRRTEDNREEVLNIALNSFPSDRRFHICPVPDNTVAELIIRRWVNELSEIYVCIHKEEVVGFLDLESFGEKDCFIHLAAVQERYRAAGAAVSLYAYAILAAKEKGFEKIHGRISSSNTAVMNLYARLGGAFASPIEVFVRTDK